jgi:hypothetical protein
MRILLQCLVFVAIAISTCLAAPVVAVDVSRSMRNYGEWQDDAKSALVAILFAGKAPNAQIWKASGNLDVLGSFRSGGNVLMLRFGSFPTQEFPYFESSQSTDAESFTSNFPNAASFRDQKTNKPLALAVAANLSSQESGEGYAVFVSDFLSDSDISRQHQEFINNTEVAFAQHIPLTLTWTKDPRLQLKFIHFHRISAAARPSDQSVTITLLPAEFYHRPDRYLLRWKAGPVFDRFSVKVEDSSSRSVVFEKVNLASKEAIFNNPPNRALRWYVVGSNTSGESVRSASQNLAGHGSPSLVLPGILVILIVGGLCLLMFKAEKLPTWMEGMLKRRKSEWS